MSESRKAGSVILANLAMFNESVMLFEDEIQPAFWEALSKAIEDWVNNPEWIGESDKYIKISPLKWRICSSEEEGYTAATFDWSFSEGNQRSYYLADLCGFGQDEMGFRFCVKHDAFGGKSKWNKFCKALPVSISSGLQALGFNDEGLGMFFIPIKLNPNLLVNAWENEDYEEIMQPVVTVLEKIKQSIPIFDELFSLAKAAGLARV